MDYIPQSSVNTIILSIFFQLSQKDDQSLTEDKIVDILEGKVGATRVRISISDLKRINFIHDVNLYGTEPWYEITGKGYEKAEEIYLSEGSSITKLIVDNGLEAFFSRDRIEALDIEAIPASDRIVSRNDNAEIVEEIESTLSQISKEISTNNQIGAELGDDKGVFEAEIQAAKDVVARERFRVSALIGWLTPLLKFVSKRFAGSSIDEAAKRLVALLESIL